MHLKQLLKHTLGTCFPFFDFEENCFLMESKFWMFFKKMMSGEDFISDAESHWQEQQRMLGGRRMDTESRGCRHCHQYGQIA